MLTLSDSGGRRQNKRQKGQKRRKYETKSQKQQKESKAAAAAAAANATIIEEQPVTIVIPSKVEQIEEGTEEHHIITGEEIKIHELMPVHYKTEDGQQVHIQAEGIEHVFETTDENQQQVICGMDGVGNSNKFFVITLLDADGHTSEAYLNAEDFTDDSSKGKGAHKQKKVLLLQKIDHPEVTQVIDGTTEAQVVEVQEQPKDDQHQLVTINFGDFEAAATPAESPNASNNDIGVWVKKFHSLSLLYTESGKPYVKCPACTAMFFKAMSFEKHISSHLQKQDERYICTFCRYSDEDPSTIFTHLFLHQDQCEVCNMNLTRKNSFKKHWELSEMSMTFTVKRDRWGRFVCIYCKLGFDLSHQLQKHWFKHSCNSKKTFQCNQCSGLFDTSEALDNHICLKCPVCDKICDSVHRLRSHTRYEKHYLYCQICSYEFILTIDHQKHLDLHKKIYHLHKDYLHCLESEDGLSFQCELCCKIYHTMSCLILHIHDDHKIQDATNNSNEVVDNGDMERITLPEVVDDLSCLKGEVLEQGTEEATFEEVEEEVGDKDCQPVALCWNRYSVDEEEEEGIVDDGSDSVQKSN